MEVSYKNKHTPTLDQQLGLNLKRSERERERELFHSSLILVIAKKVKTIQMFVNRAMDQQIGFIRITEYYPAIEEE